MGSQLKQTVSETVLATTADLSTVVHTTGNESVSGVKTFANNLFVGDGSSNNVIIANNAIKQMVNGTTKTYNFPSIGGTLALTSDLAGYLPLSGGIVTDDVLETIQQPYMNNIMTLVDEMDGTNNAIEITVTADVSRQEMVYMINTSTYRPISCNVVVNSITGNSADFPFDITVLTGDYQITYDSSEQCYKHVSGNQQFEIWLESNGDLDVYFSDVNEEHFYGTEGVVINESQKSINSRFITESEIDDRFKYNSDFTLWRKGSTIYAGTNADSLSGYTNGIFFGNNIKSSGANNVIIGNGAYNMSGSSVVIGVGASATKSGNVSIGPYAYTYGSSTAVAIGSGARASYLGTAVGPVASAIGGDSSVAVGWKTKAGNGKDVAIGREAQTSGSDGNFSNIAIGAWSKAYATGGSPCISIGGNTVSGTASVGIYNTTPLYGAWSAALLGSVTGDNSVAIGGNVSANYAVQLGNGTNSTNSTLQFLSKKIADSNGYLYENNANINTIYQPISAMSAYVEKSWLDGSNIAAGSAANTSAEAAYDCVVEWLQTDGTAYIDTGIVGTNELKVDMKFEEDKTNAHIDTTTFVFGARTNTSSGVFLLMYRPSNSTSTPKGVMTLGYDTSTSTISPNYQSSTNPFIVKTGMVDKSFSYRHLTLNGEQWSTSVVSFTNGLNNYLFAINNGGTGLVSTSSSGYQRIYYCKIWKNDELVRDFIPVRKNGVGYMFDRVSKTLFGNAAGSGAFTYGSDAEAQNLSTAVAIGKDAVAADNALQLGNGTNDAPKSFYIGNALLLDHNGKIQKESLDPDFLQNLNLKFAMCNTNLQGISTWLASGIKVTTLTVDSRASGWTFSSDGGTTWDNKMRFVHWGQYGLIFGNARSSAAITANTSQSSIGTITLPSGYTMYGAGIGGAGVGEYFSITGAGTISVRNFTGKSANTGLGIRISVTLNSIGDRWSHRNVSTL